jgi:hypothetical protein
MRRPPARWPLPLPRRLPPPATDHFCRLWQPAEGRNFTSAYSAAQIYIHSRAEILSFFEGLELVPPGVVSVMSWNGDGPPLQPTPPTATFVGGVARKLRP